MQLTELVERRAERGVLRVAQVAMSILRCSRGIPPRASSLQHLRPMHQALPAEGNEVRLLRTPVCEHVGPLRGPAQIECIDARLDDAAVDDPRRDRRHLPGCHRDHCVVERPHARGGLAERDRRLALAQQAEREQVVVVATTGDVDDAAGQRSGLVDVAGLVRVQERRDEHEPRRGALAVDLRHRPLGTGEPTSGAGRMTEEEQDERGPECAPGCRGASPVARCAWWARSHAATLSSSWPVRLAAMARRSRSAAARSPLGTSSS